MPLAYATLAGRKRAMAAIGQTRSGLIEDALIVAAGAAVIMLATRAKRRQRLLAAFTDSAAEPRER